MGGSTGHGARSARNMAAAQAFGSQNLVAGAVPITKAVNDMIMNALGVKVGEGGDLEFGESKLPSTFAPIVANAVEDSKQGTSRALDYAKRAFAQQGLGGSSLLANTLSNLSFQGQQNTAGIESQALQTLFNLAPVFGLSAQQTGLGLVGQGSANLSAAGSLEMSSRAQRAQLISSLGSTLGSGLGQIIGSGIGSGGAFNQGNQGTTGVPGGIGDPNAGASVDTGGYGA